MLRNIPQNDWFTVLIVVCLGLIALSKLLYGKRFNDLMAIFNNSNYLKVYVKEQKFINVFDGLLFLNLVISLTIFTQIAYKTFYSSQQIQSLDLYYRLIVGLGSLILIKVLIDRLIGSLFEIDGIMNFYVFQKITFKHLIGLVLLPINILLIFTIHPSQNIIYAIILLLLVLNFLGFSMSLTNNLKTIKGNLFYFILYLCALEIAPYIILFKVV